ncbi:MAG: glucokinase [Flavobacteriales bacterium]|nr:glucokinase [Flavobacteriales bacterium]|tara:strand:- start:1628 stop:2548 length:921 start_codon:yes stop_codon:yes gene_type:complete
MILGIDIGGTTVKFGIVTNKGEILATERHDTLENAQTSEDFMGLLIDISKKYIASYPQVKGIGIGIPGQLSLDRTTLVQANNLGALNGTKIVPILKETFPDLIVRMENDANCTALGEMYFGGHEKDNFIMIALGTGVGGGVIVHRKLFIGAKGNAGEVGFLVVGPQRQVLENYLGQRHLTNYVKEELKKPVNGFSLLHSEDELTVEKVFHAAKAGDRFALNVWDYVGELIGETVVGLAHAYDITQFVIGGGVGKAFELFEASAKKTALSYFSPYYADTFELLPAGCEADTGLIGAASLVLNELETF